MAIMKGQYRDVSRNRKYGATEIFCPKHEWKWSKADALVEHTASSVELITTGRAIRQDRRWEDLHLPG